MRGKLDSTRSESQNFSNTVIIAIFSSIKTEQNNYAIPPYSQTAMDYIKAIQKTKLQAQFGLDFESNLSNIFPSESFFHDFIETQLKSEFNEDDDKLYELEAQLKNNALEKITNVTEFEFSQYKSLLNSTELKFRQCVLPAYCKDIPYNATLYSDLPDAEICFFTDLEKPIIFFHGGLFSANLMFCKLYAQLSNENSPLDNQDAYLKFVVKSDPESIKILNLNAIYFYNYYLSEESSECPTYELKTPFENNILAQLLDSIALFIYSHEAGHAILKHNHDIEKPITELHREEFEADRFAMIHLLNYCNHSGKGTIITLLAPIVFFRYRIFLERYKPAIGYIKTHPSTTDRLEKYVTWLNQKIHPADRQTVISFLTYEQQVFDKLKEIFDRIHTLVTNKKKINTND